MNILEVNYSDKVGHIFNGYDLHNALLKLGINAKQIVLDKRTSDDSVVKLRTDMILHQQIREIERQYSISNLLYPYGEEVVNLKEFQEADIVHYHILHNGMISLLDYPMLMNRKPTVWTIHDPWLITGSCIYPLECQKWKSGCEGCERYDDPNIPMACDNALFMWKVKLNILSQINPIIVVSCNYMKEYLKNSPLTKHFNKIEVIPFGIQIEKYNVKNKKSAKKKFLKKDGNIIIGFRVESNYIKGNTYLFDALRKIEKKDKIELICVGSGVIPNDIKECFAVTELGWIDDENKMIEFFWATDIFIMPSLAETFGVMAIEAMAAECCVICFKDTILEEVTNSPDCGISVSYKSSQEICKVIEQLLDNSEEIEYRGKKSRKYIEKTYLFETYVESHKVLYERIMEECKGHVR